MENKEIASKSACVTTCSLHSGVEARLNMHEKSLERLQEILERVMNRPSYTIVAVLTILTGTLGFCISLLTKLIS